VEVVGEGAQPVICFLRHSYVIQLQSFFSTPLEIAFFLGVLCSAREYLFSVLDL
jgi:hypothetical protein